MVKLDSIDLKILDLLQKNAKITNAQLSQEIGLSPAPTLERVKKLEGNGVIKGYNAELDLRTVGLGVSTFVQVALKGHNRSNINTFLEAIDHIHEVVECHHVTGVGDFILKIVAKDIESYQKLMLEKLSEIKSVDSMQSMVILSTFKDSKTLPVPSD